MISITEVFVNHMRNKRKNFSSLEEQRIDRREFLAGVCRSGSALLLSLVPNIATATTTTVTLSGTATKFNPDFIVLCSSSGPIIYDGNLNNVTATYAGSPGFSIAASHEQMIKPPRQSKWIGFGTWCGSGGAKGAIADIRTTPWTYYKDFGGFTGNGSGSDYIRHMAPGPGDYVAGFMASTNDEAVHNITTKSEAGGYPAEFTSFNDQLLKVYDNYLYQWSSGGIYKYLFTGSTPTLQASNTSYQTGNPQCALSVNSTGTKIVASNSSNLHFFNGALVFQSTFNMSSLGMSNAETIEFSPNDRYILIGGSHSSGLSGCVIIYDTNTSTATAMTVPTGSSNARFTGCAWFPDNDGYVMSGYVGAKSHIGRFSSGGKTTDLTVTPYSLGSCFGAACITI